MTNQLRICLASGLPISRVGVEAPTCSLSPKPPAIAVHDSVETPRSASRQCQYKWVSKYAFELEWSSLSTSSKTGAQQVTCSFPGLESGSCIWIRDAWVKYLFWGNSTPKTAFFSLWLATTSCPQRYPIDLILFPQLSWDQFQLPVWPTLCPQ